MGGTVRSALAGLGLMLIAALPANAATWSVSTPLNAAGATIEFGPSVALDGAGNGVAAWSQVENGVAVIRVADHAPSGGSAPAAAPLSAGIGGNACDVFASVDDQGNALVAWFQYTGPVCDSGNQQMWFANRAAGAAWSAPHQVGASLQDGDGNPAAGTNEFGQMVVAWETTEGAQDKVYATVGSPTTGFAAPASVTTVSTAVNLAPLAVGIGPLGDAAVQWPENANLRSAVTHSGGFAGASTAPIAVGTNGSVALDGAGNLISIYAVSGTTLTSRYKLNGDAYQTAQPLTTVAAGSTVQSYSVRFDDNGGATAAWVEQAAGGSGRLVTATRPIGGAWEGVTPLSGLVAAPGAPSLAVNGSGAAAIAWNVLAPSHTLLWTRTPLAGFGPPTDIGVCSSPEVAIAGIGDALAGCQETAAGPVRVSVVDTHLPAISSVDIPSNAIVGKPVAMSMALGYAWTPLAPGQPTWSFGDGSAGAGAPVAHTYTAPGTYTVTVAATDAAGNIATPITGTITVSAATGPSGGGGGGGDGSDLIEEPSITASYVDGKLVGSIGLGGTSPVATTLTIAIKKQGAKKPVATSKLKIKAGKWSKTITLPASLKPGSYTVTASGKGVATTSAGFKIPVPKTGLTNHVYASGTQHGPAVLKIASTTQLWAHFHFGAVPKKGLAITTQWTLPTGSKLAANTRPRSSLVEAQVKDLKGHQLPKGTWRCVLRVGGKVVATATVTLGR